MGTRYNPNAQKDELFTLSQSLTANPPAGQPMIVLDGQTFLITDIAAKLADIGAKFQAAEDAGQQYKTALADRTAIEPMAKALCQKVKRALKGTLGPKNQALGKYGIRPAKEPRQLTVQEETVRVAKAKATRVARHTMGKRQKEHVKGEVPPPVRPAKEL